MSGRIFFAPFVQEDKEFSISGDEFFHITTVLRASEGDRIEVVNGRGAWCEGVITKITSHSLRVHVQKKEVEAKSPVKIVLAPSLSKSHNTHWMMEKLAEIGIDQVRPIICERTETNRRMRSSFWVEKWKKIAAQAVKVNRRLWLTEIFPPIELDLFINTLNSFSGKYFLDTEGQKCKNKEWDFPVVVLIGPPGDFTPKEKGRLKDIGFAGIKINDAILKTETAAISIAAILKYD